MWNKILNIIRLLMRLNITQTIYINFKMFPMRVALHTPIYVYGKAKFRELNGRINIKAPISRGLIKIGKNDYYVRTAVPLTYWVLNGTINFYGSTKFMNGGYLCVSRNGVLDVGHDCLIGSDYRIMCFEKISLGHRFECTYSCQIYDTSFHYVQQKDGSVAKLTTPIIIGNDVWIGNSTTITKGAVISDYAIVANCSLVNKDCRYVNEGGLGYLIAGVPANIKRVGISRIFDNQLETHYDNVYGYDRTHL